MYISSSPGNSVVTFLDTLLSNQKPWEVVTFIFLVSVVTSTYSGAVYDSTSEISPSINSFLPSIQSQTFILVSLVTSLACIKVPSDNSISVLPTTDWKPLKDPPPESESEPDAT